MDERMLDVLREILLEANNFLITSHKRPDGDAVGSVLGLGLTLQKTGKDVQMILEDGVPSSFKHLEGIKQIRKKVQRPYDISIVLDCSDLERVGRVLEPGTVPTINIDHHITNLKFAKHNLVDVNATATAEILTTLLEKIGFQIYLPAADAFLTGIITDTVGFRTSSIHSGALRIAADLMDLGCDLSFLYQRALIDKSFQAIQFWGAGLLTSQMEDGLVWAKLTLADRQTIGYPGKDDADLVNVLSSVESADIAVIFVEQPGEKVKVSWRAQKGFDVSEIASQFGGGGHKPAAGAELTGSLEAVQSKVLKVTRNYLNNR